MITSISNFLPWVKLNGAARKIVADLRRAQQLAVTEQNRHLVRFSINNPNNNTYQLIRVVGDSEEVVASNEISSGISVFLDLSGGQLSSLRSDPVLSAPSETSMIHSMFTIAGEDLTEDYAADRYVSFSADGNSSYYKIISSTFNASGVGLTSVWTDGNLDFVDAGDTVNLYEGQPSTTTSEVSFGSSGEPSSSGTVTLTNSKGGSRRIEISPSGQIKEGK
jgi:hypothetical protein